MERIDSIVSYQKFHANKIHSLLMNIDGRHKTRKTTIAKL